VADLFEAYRLEDAELAVAVMSSAAGAAKAALGIRVKSRAINRTRERKRFKGETDRIDMGSFSLG